MGKLLLLFDHHRIELLYVIPALDKCSTVYIQSE